MIGNRNGSRRLRGALGTRHAALLALVGGIVVPPGASASDVKWEGGITTVYQHSDDSRAETEVTASADLFATLTMGRGEWFAYIEASTTPRSGGVSALYPTVNGDAGSVLTKGGNGGVQLSEFNYTFRYDSDHLLTLGLIDPSAWLDRGRIANDETSQFLNGSFVNNATIEFPDYTLGAIYSAPGTGTRPAVTLVVAGSDGIADLPDGSYQDLLDFNEDGRGAFVGAGANWLFDRSSWRVGAWVRTDDHTVAGSDTDIEQNYGAYAVYGWQSGGNALNVRAGLANSDVSVARGFFALAYQRKYKLGQFGIGTAYTGISSGFRSGGPDSAIDSEVYFRVPVFDGAGHVTPSIQYVEVPGFDADQAVPGATAIVAGVRFHYSFQE